MSRLYRFGVSRCAIGALTLVGASGVGRAAPVVQDSFTVPPYSGSADITTQNPATTGGAAPWSASTLLDVGAAGTGLFFPSSYSTAANTDRAIALTQSTVGTGGNNRIGTRGVTAPAAVGSSNVTVWASGLLLVNDADNIGRATWGFLGTGSGPNVTNTLGTAAVANQNLVGFGYLNGVAVVLPNNDAAAAVTLTTPASAPVTVGDNATHFFVLKIERNVAGTTDRVTAWLDPASGTSEAVLDSTAIAKGVSGTLDFWEDTEPFSRIGVDADQIGANAARYDEIRIGPALADVAVPEPASLGLLAVAGAALLGRRRATA